MAVRKIVVCGTEDAALVEKNILENDGYTTSGPDFFERIIWDATNAGGAGDIRADAWVVEGIK